MSVTSKTATQNSIWSALLKTKRKIHQDLMLFRQIIMICAGLVM